MISPTAHPDAVHTARFDASNLQTSARSLGRPTKEFDEVLATERGRLAREAATQFVADAFVVPALAMMRDGPFAPEDGPFATTTTERRFGPMFDSLMADRIVQSTRWPLVDSVAKRLLNVSQSTGGAQMGEWHA